ncbi:MAG: hypothetical protein KatS3mg016_0501 [Fimbriimonadales bacterium]|nr:MAG: hypothetical protein KatS3mg016_0501 [Fimbriimonadales bacterium]
MRDLYVLWLGIFGLLISLLIVMRVYKVMSKIQHGLDAHDILRMIVGIMGLGLLLSQLGSHLGYLGGVEARVLTVFFALSMMSLIYTYLVLRRKL